MRAAIVARDMGRASPYVGVWGLGRGGMHPSIIVWSGRFRGLIFRNMGDGELRESVFLDSFFTEKCVKLPVEYSKF